MTDAEWKFLGFTFHYVRTGRLRSLYIRRDLTALYTVRRRSWERARWSFVPSAPKPVAVEPHPDILRTAMVNASEAEAA